MHFTSYENFDLLIGRGPSRYRADVVRSLAGEPSADFDLPFREDELAAVLGRAARGSRDLFDADPGQEPAAAMNPRSFGERLYRAVFTGAVETALLRSLDEAARRNCGLRIRLQIGDSVADLAGLPWEYLFAPHLNRFLALSDESPLVRYLRLSHGEAVQPLRVTPPLLILAAVANPSGVAPLAVEQEWARLQQALAGLAGRRLIRLERLPAATLPALQDRLGDAQQGAVHIFHFIGHGFFDAAGERGGLVFEREDGSADLAAADRVGTILCGHRSLRLAFLNSCQGARGGRGSVFGGVAQYLVQQGVLAVVAMQFPISDAAASILSAKFYERLAEGDPADSALTEARKAIVAASESLEWGTPVLFSRSLDNRILVQPDTAAANAETASGLAPALAKIDTNGGAFVGGNVNTGGGRFIGRDEIINETTVIVSTPEQAVTISKRLQQRAELLQSELKPKPCEPETILIPAGPFLMGSDDSAAPAWERPQHTLALPAFRIGKYPVTNAQYLAFARERRIAVAPETGWRLAPVGQEPPPGRENHPVVGITWDTAVAYCRWLGDKTGRRYRLPSEAEWEKAARGPETGTDETRAYPWGNCFDPSRCNCAEAGRRDTTAVGSYSTQGDSPYGAADMAGNVWEWTSTRWGTDPSRPQYTYPYDSGDGRENLGKDEPFREYRIARGGSYQDGANRVTCTVRECHAADEADPRRGFRIAMGISEDES